MVVAACACDDRLVPSRLEIDRPGDIYTYDTLTEIRQEYRKAELFFIIGTDSLMQLHTWHRFKDLFPLCTFLVCPRQDVSSSAECAAQVEKLSALGGRFLSVPMELIPASSTSIRSALASGLFPDDLPVPVMEYCRCKGLYGCPGKIDQADSWIEMLFSALKPGRFAHSLSVAFTARKLAVIHGADPIRAEQAGLLHDCAKYIPLKEMQQIASAYSLTDDPAMLESTALLHSIVGAQVAEARYGMKDPEVLEAIRYHNTGCAGMSRLAMGVCLADSIEPLHKSYPLLDKVRSLSEHSLEQALLLSLEGTADYVISRGKYLHPRTQETISWLRSLVGSCTPAGKADF